MHAGLGGRCANMTGFGISQSAPLSTPPISPRIITASLDASTKSTHISLSELNTVAVTDGNAAWQNVGGTVFTNWGRRYLEFKYKNQMTLTGQLRAVGLADANVPMADGQFIGGSVTGNSWSVYHSGSTGPAKYHNGSSGSSTLNLGQNSALPYSMLWDAELGTLIVWAAGVSAGVIYSGVIGMLRPVFSANFQTASMIDVTVNFGQLPFVFPMPSGYTRWRKGWRI